MAKGVSCPRDLARPMAMAVFPVPSRDFTVLDHLKDDAGGFAVYGAFFDKEVLVKASAVQEINYFQGFPGKPTLPDNYEEDTWARLRSAITAIFLKQRDSCELQILYKAVDGLCTMKSGRNLYQRIEKECDEHLQQSNH